jgi:D-alanyl-D-alanine carboxypeptidase (penicillin-binding protein 5/6)/beta-lactamase class A
MLAVAVCLLAAVAHPSAAHPAADPAPTLEARITPLVRSHKGRIAVAIKNLTTGDEFYLNADDRLPTASLIKLPILVETYWQAAEGKIQLDTKLTLTDKDKVPGSGILRDHFSEGTTFPLRDAARLMIVFSDNTATNLVLDQIGLPSTNARMEKLGLKNTKVTAKVFRGSTTSIDPEATKKYGLGSTTAREMVQLLALIEAGEVVSPQACREMLKTLKACEDKSLFARFLPAGMELAHKTGAVSDARTSAGIAYTHSGPVALCVLTAENEDRRWTPDNAAELLIARIAREVYEHFPPPPPKTPKK